MAAVTTMSQRERRVAGNPFAVVFDFMMRKTHRENA